MGKKVVGSLFVHVGIVIGVAYVIGMCERTKKSPDTHTAVPGMQRQSHLISTHGVRVTQAHSYVSNKNHPQFKVPRDHLSVRSYYQRLGRCALLYAQLCQITRATKQMDDPAFCASLRRLILLGHALVRQS